MAQLGCEPAFAATRFMVALINWAIASGWSSWRKWPAFLIVVCGCPLAPGIRDWKTASPPRVIGSRSLKAVMKGRSNRSSTCHAALFSATDGCASVIGTSAGKIRAPALKVSSGNGAS